MGKTGLSKVYICRFAFALFSNVLERGRLVGSECQELADGINISYERCLVRYNVWRKPQWRVRSIREDPYSWLMLRFVVFRDVGSAGWSSSCGRKLTKAR